MKTDQLIAYIKEKGIVRAKEIVDLGLPRAYLHQMATKGVIECIGRGLYQWPGYSPTQWQSFIEVSKRNPKGVICLMSALVFHNLTTQNPFEVWLAIDQKGWRPKMDYPQIRIISMSGQSLVEGVDTHLINGHAIKVFSIAKTVVDCFKFRNKIGIDVGVEALREGWQNNKFTIDELTHYAKICRVTQVIRPYIESLL